MAEAKGRLAYLSEASTQELLNELERRRIEALQLCSGEEIESELAKRPEYDGPRLVEK